MMTGSSFMSVDRIFGIFGTKMLEKEGNVVVAGYGTVEVTSVITLSPRGRVVLGSQFDWTIRSALVLTSEEEKIDCVGIVHAHHLKVKIITISVQKRWPKVT